MIEVESVKTDSPKFLEKLCEYFANIGTIMSPILPFSQSSTFKIHPSSCVQSFMIEKILSEDVSDCIDQGRASFSYEEPDLEKLLKPQAAR